MSQKRKSSNTFALPPPKLQKPRMPLRTRTCTLPRKYESRKTCPCSLPNRQVITEATLTYVAQFWIIHCLRQHTIGICDAHSAARIERPSPKCDGDPNIPAGACVQSWVPKYEIGVPDLPLLEECQGRPSRHIDLCDLNVQIRETTTTRRRPGKPDFVRASTRDANDIVELGPKYPIRARGTWARRHECGKIGWPVVNPDIFPEVGYS